MRGLSSALSPGVLALLVASTFAACGSRELPSVEDGGGGDATADATGPPVDATGGDATAADAGDAPADAPVDATGGDATAADAGDAPADAPVDAPVVAPADAGREDCTNGVDDNGDGEIDCADPQCTPGYECVPTVPTDWTGYFRVNTSANPSAQVPCPGGGVPTTTFESTAGAAQCSACTCDSLSGATCDPPLLRCYAGSDNCSSGGGTDWTPVLADGFCHKPSNLIGVNSTLACELSGTSSVANAGSCTPSAVDFDNKQTFATQVDACVLTAAGGGCSAGSTCVPKTSPPYAATACVKKDGANTCPAGFPTRHATFTGGTDTRGCTGCECDALNTSCTAGSYTFYDLDACAAGGDAPVVLSSTTCANLSVLLDQLSWSVQASLPAASGTCTPDGGVATGGVATIGEATLCCQ